MSLNIKKAKYIFFDNVFKNDILLKLPELKIPNKTFDRKRYIKFSGLMLDENMLWRIHMCTKENKI